MHRDVGRWLYVALRVKTEKDRTAAIEKALKLIEDRAAVVVTGDREGWAVAGALANLRKGEFLKDYKGDLAMARKYQSKNEGKKAFPGGSQGGYSQGGGQSGGAQPGGQQGGQGMQQQRRFSLNCFSCNQPGHLARDCNRRPYGQNGGGTGGAPTR